LFAKAMLYYLDIVLTFYGWWHPAPMPYLDEEFVLCQKFLGYLH
jgi:hypothetical protein